MKEKKRKPILFHYISFGIIVGIFLKIFIIDIISVQGISMSPKICDNEKIIVSKIYYGLINPFNESTIIRWKKPERDDIVVFFYNNNLIVKRCVAIEGDYLAYSSNSGYTLVVGNKNYSLSEQQYNFMQNTRYVPKDMIFVIGDNFENSIDSRTYGFVPWKSILGKVIFK